VANTKARSRSSARPASRKGRAAELKRRRERRSIRNRLLFAAVVLALVGVVVFAEVQRDTGSSDGTQPTPPTSTSTSCKADAKYDGESRAHVPDPTYKVNPPAGGAHLPVPAPPGFYQVGQPVPPDGALVHAMEHGFIVLWYKPGLDAASMQKLSALSDRFGRALILAPRASLAGPVAVTAWHHRLLCSAIDADAIAAFATANADKGPEKGFM
jgi:hypothetical protein